MYLTLAEYELFTGKSIEESKFKELLPKASDVLDHVTGHFYARKDINNDVYLWRAKQFKKSLCAQIEYFDEVGTTTYEGINKQPQSFSVGRTSVTNITRNEDKSVVAKEVYMYLSNTGLLYRGM